MKIGVFGNCQSVGMAESISALMPDAEIHRYGVREAQDSDYVEIAAQMAAFETCDHVFLQPSTKHTIEGLQLDNFKDHCQNLVYYPLIASRASHPDCHYLTGANGMQFVGPMGQYQSAIAAGSFISGLTVERAVMLFNAFTYRSLGFFNISNATEAVGREAIALGYDFSDFISGDRGLFMHTINHPMIEIIFETARQGLKKIGCEPKDWVAPPRDSLARSTIWPVYSGLSRKSDRSDFTFRWEARGIKMSLREFVEASYGAFGAANGAFRSDLTDKVRNFIVEHVR